jgi:hypothetical protein
MGLTKFLCCLFPGRCGHDAPESEARAGAASAPSDVQPNTPGKRERPQEPPSSPDEELPSPS